MSDMLGHGASGGAGSWRPSESHDEFLELCATATTGSLNVEDRAKLKEHLAKCESCREIMSQYEVVIGKVVSALAPDWTEEQCAPSPWSLEEAEAQLLARLGESDIVPEARGSRDRILPARSLQTFKERPSWGVTLWKHMWGHFAAASLLIVALGLIGYRIGLRRGLDLAPQAPIPTSLNPAPDMPSRMEIPTSQPTHAPREGTTNSQVQALRSEVEGSLAEIGRLKAQQAQSEKELGFMKADRETAAQDHAELSRQLEVAHGSLESLQQRLESATSQNSENSARAAALDQRVNQLNEAVLARGLEVARERELLDHDRDIRELMGSRDLYVAEVYDIAKTGDTQKPFGRVFYTSGKSLIFYAYDLDEQPGIERASTFQVWGRRGPDRDHAVNLGILYQDSASKKRWVLKSDDPKTLAQIDAVFVTVEPNGGSTRPSGKALLFAYLRVEPNHP
jgi:Anti-sigma-K factor rskA